MHEYTTLLQYSWNRNPTTVGYIEMHSFMDRKDETRIHILKNDFFIKRTFMKA